MYPPPGAAMSIASRASAITSSGVPNGSVRDESMLPMRPKRAAVVLFHPAQIHVSGALHRVDGRDFGLRKIGQIGLEMSAAVQQHRHAQPVHVLHQFRQVGQIVLLEVARLHEPTAAVAQVIPDPDGIRARRNGQARGLHVVVVRQPGRCRSARKDRHRARSRSARSPSAARVVVNGPVMPGHMARLSWSSLWNSSNIAVRPGSVGSGETHRLRSSCDLMG